MHADWCRYKNIDDDEWRRVTKHVEIQDVLSLCPRCKTLVSDRKDVYIQTSYVCDRFLGELSMIDEIVTEDPITDRCYEFIDAFAKKWDWDREHDIMAKSVHIAGHLVVVAAHFDPRLSRVVIHHDGWKITYHIGSESTYTIAVDGKDPHVDNPLHINTGARATVAHVELHDMYELVRGTLMTLFILR